MLYIHRLLNHKLLRPYVKKVVKSDGSIVLRLLVFPVNNTNNPHLKLLQLIGSLSNMDDIDIVCHIIKQNYEESSNGYHIVEKEVSYGNITQHDIDLIKKSISTNNYMLLSECRNKPLVYAYLKKNSSVLDMDTIHTAIFDMYLHYKVIMKEELCKFEVKRFLFCFVTHVERSINYEPIQDFHMWDFNNFQSFVDIYSRDKDEFMKYVYD